MSEHEEIDWDEHVTRERGDPWPREMPVDVAMAVNNTAAFPESVTDARWTDDQLQWSRDGGLTWEMD